MHTCRQPLQIGQFCIRIPLQYIIVCLCTVPGHLRSEVRYTNGNIRRKLLSSSVLVHQGHLMLPLHVVSSKVSFSNLCVCHGICCIAVHIIKIFFFCHTYHSALLNIVNQNERYVKSKEYYSCVKKFKIASGSKK